MSNKAPALKTAQAAVSQSTELHQALQRYFGFTTFRPLQQEIIAETLAGRDVFALLPTGGGKSLCYQLPALMLPGLTVIVSPLIALMKDQVDGLLANGIPATFLNSTLQGIDVQARIADLDAGRCRLLYLAPERLLLPESLEQLRRWNVSLIAVDEAHCISEWGHDFRPEYRQLARLRELFPQVPLAVFTATATERVRQDIVEQLRLRQPHCFVASFNRPNLLYRVLPKQQPDEQVLELLRRRPNDSAIVYCQARQTTQDVADWLSTHGLRARPYHAGLSAEQRNQNQELFRRDEVQVICATIAFGMGVNKPNIRFVIHYDLPKNIESYYQETGRAGRDSLPSECVLLFSRGDVAKQMRFIEDKEAHEAEIARKQLWRMVDYAETSGCRRLPLLKYFGETYPQANCQACDYCTGPREEYDGTLAAQKYMSCLFRIRQRSPDFGASPRYVSDVLRGEPSEVIQRWQHQSLSTFGIGKDFTQEQWLELGRELTRLGLVRQLQDGRYERVELTAEGQRVLSERQKVMLSRSQNRPATSSGKKQRRAQAAAQGQIECDEALFERLRSLRKRLADEREVPAYVVFSDASLREMARAYPESDPEFSGISGVGEKKRQEYAAPFLAEIKTYLKDHEPKVFGLLAPAKAKPRMNRTCKESLRLFDGGASVAEIARQRELTEDTVWDHLIEAVRSGEQLDIARFLTPQQRIDIAGALVESDGLLKPVFERLDGQYSYGVLRLFRELAQNAENDKKPTIGHP